jgi:hypothetical protein
MEPNPVEPNPVGLNPWPTKAVKSIYPESFTITESFTIIHGLVM